MDVHVKLTADFFFLLLELSVWCLGIYH